LTKVVCMLRHLRHDGSDIMAQSPRNKHDL